MPAKKKNNTMVNDVKSDIERCKKIEEKLCECDDESDEVSEKNETNDLIDTQEEKQDKYDKISYNPETYVFKFGKYKNMLAKDVKNIKIERTNKQSGESFMAESGKQYLEFLLSLSLLHKADKKVIAKILYTD